MGPITAIFPTARVVPCAGRLVKVAEFRLRDLVRLQAILDDLEPDPLAEAQEAMRGLPPRECDLLLGQAYDKAEAGPPCYGDERARAYFSTPEGGSLFLWVALGRSQDVSPVEAANLYLECTAIEYGRIWRVCHGVSAYEAISRIMLPPSPGGQPANRATWYELAYDTIANHAGYTFETLLDVTISQWICLRNGGKPPSFDRAILPGEDVAALCEAQRRFWGEDQ